MKVDYEKFQSLMKESRELAKKNWKGSGDDSIDEIWFGIKDKLGPTEFLGYETNQAEGVVISLLKNSKEVDSLNNGEEGIIICNQTPFYGESGGQVGDTGTISSEKFIFEVIDVPIEVKDKPNAITLKNIDGSIEFKKVTFGYVPDEPILTDISFKVEPGETVALVGPTGSGKTSITSLTHRFYDVWEGEVFVGGKNVKDVTQSSLSQQVGMVLQEPFLFTGTVIENIRYVNVDCPLSEVVKAAQAVGAHDFICQLPNGYDSMLEQRGGNISLGQRQLLSFARAIVANTKILILDEATASVDSYTEMLIQDALSKLLKGRTGMVIAHRLATIRSADRIIVLQDGKIIETGTHDELVATNGLYSHMYSLNYSSFDDIPDDLIKEVTREWREGIT